MRVPENGEALMALDCEKPKEVERPQWDYVTVSAPNSAQLDVIVKRYLNDRYGSWALVGGQFIGPDGIHHQAMSRRKGKPWERRRENQR